MDGFLGKKPRWVRETGACFVAGTLVHTREGLRPIEQIKAGDYVLSRPEDGGDNVYKRVITTIESDAQETWYLSWEDPQLLKELKGGLSREEFLDAYGNGFVVTTPNHPFWVVDSDEEMLQYEESHVRLGPPYPRREWVRADRLAAGMRLLLADGRTVNVLKSTRVYKAGAQAQGWVDKMGDGARGLMIDFAGQGVVPNVHAHSGRFDTHGNIAAGLVENPDESYANDYPPGSAPQSWYLSKVYNLEVEDSHAYFVDTMGVCA